jgi:predicted lipase
VHEGFTDAFESVKQKFRDQVDIMRKRYPKAKLMITGHSLGGALAIMASADLIYQKIPIDQIYTFGQPRVGNRAFK